jgi:DNA (cytosine-5)-methyltransferase 1
MIEVGSDFSGVGAFDQALMKLNIKYKTIFSCDMDKFARQSYIANYGEPDYYPENVYEREIPEKSLDIYMTSPPCQSFSLAGKREGKQSKNGILFFNSHEFIKKNQPRFFIFENVKGLLSDDGGKTFSEWCNMLGGKSINGLPVLFPYDNAVQYHIYWSVLNSKHFGVPQNRERVFIVGIRDDVDNKFQFPKKITLKKKLKDVLEDDVDQKYFLSDKALESVIKGTHEHSSRIYDIEKTAQTLDTACNQGVIIPLFQWGSGSRDGRWVYDKNGISPCMTTGMGTGGGVTPSIIVHNIPEFVNVRKYEVDIERLQKCLKTHKNKTIKSIAEHLNVAKTEAEHWFRSDNSFSIPRPEIWLNLKQLLNIETDEFDESIMTFEEKESVFEKSNRVYDSNGLSPTMTATSADERILNNSKIRRLTPRECFRLQDFPDSFKFVVSDTQLYKQAGNSITTGVLAKIIEKLPIK